MKPIQLDYSRQNLKPRPKGLTEDEYLLMAIKEGHQLLELEEKAKAKPAPSVKQPDASKVQDALGKMSDNPYLKARAQIMDKMLPSVKTAIEQMEAGTLTKDKRYDKFCTDVTELGDKLSGLN
jgi:hypothetical protein